MSDVELSSERPRFLSLPAMRYQNAYVWLVLVSALDILLTAMVLHTWSGNEVNPVVEAIIHKKGFAWIVPFKLAMCILVIIICEVVGRHRNQLGHRLAVTAVIISAFPVAFTFLLLRAAGPAPVVEDISAQISMICRLPIFVA